MKKILLLLFFLQTLLFSCASCALMVPTVELDMDVKMQANRLEKIYFTWHFSDIYTSEVTAQFDKNKNQKLDEAEIQNILNAMLEYLKPKNMLTSLQYADQNTTKPMSLHPKYENFQLKIVDEFLVFTYKGILEKEITPSSTLSMAFEDDESFFAFIMSRLHINDSDFSYTQNLYLFTASISFLEKMAFEEEAQMQANPVVSPKEQAPEEKKPQILQTQEPEPLQENFLKESMEKIKSLFSSIKDEKNPMTYLVLLLFAFLYGIVHAMGPGHGKTLVASYFLANERSCSKALFISLAIGAVHTFSAFLLTLFIYFVLSTLLAQFLDDAIFYTTKISALIIISIALYLLYKKHTLYKGIQNASKTPSFSFSTEPVHVDSCACSSCKVDKNSTDFALIVSAGIIPCPGTTTIFIFAISMGLYYAGFIAALVMSLGMSSVIFFSALLSTIVRTKFLGTSQKLKKYLEFASLGLILLLGGVLLFAS